MTIAHAIARFDTLYPNVFSYTEKLKWLSDLDGTVFYGIMSAYEDAEVKEFSGYDIYTDKKTSLLIPFPYDDIYIKYLAAQCDCANSDSVRYQNSSLLFNSAYSEFANYFNKTHKAIPTRITY